METIIINDYISFLKIDGSIKSVQINHDGIWHNVPYNSDTYTFNESDPLTQELRQWEAVNGALDLPLPPPPPNVSGLADTIRGTEVFAKVYAEVELPNPKVVAAFTILIPTLNSSNPNLKDLRFSLEGLRAGMGDLLNTEDIEFINQALADNFFNYSI